MNADADAARRNATVKFQNLDIGEPICVRLAGFDSHAELRTCLKQLLSAPTPGLTLVMQLPCSLGEQELLGLLDRATGRASRVVLIPPRINRTAFEKLLLNAGQRRWPCPVQFEPEALGAIVGTMQSLQAGDTLALLWPDEAGLDDPTSLVALGARWRASWEAPEEGEFHWLPAAAGIS